MIMAVPPTPSFMPAPAAFPTAASSPSQPTQPTTPASPFFSPARKRHAASPSEREESLGTSSPWAPAASSSPASDTTVHREKRRRPNLTNGFSGLSISPTGQACFQSANAMGGHQAAEDDGDEGLGPSSYPINSGDVRVEVLPEPSLRGRHHHNSTLHHWSIPNQAGPSSSSSSTSPTTSGEENYDSDVTFTRQFPRARRYAGVAQQADEIVQPDAKPYMGAELGVEDVTCVPRPLNGRRPRDEDDDDAWKRGGKRRRGNDMDVEMGGEGNENVEEIPRHSDDKMRGRKTVWYEPEKDRIVVTSLSDTSSTPSRSPSPESTRDRLSQPGVQGFTISPSLLTHLLNAQRDLNLHGSLESMIKKAERSLTLYRPPGSAPIALPEAIVKAWEEHSRPQYEDSGRFEEVDDDVSMGDDGSGMALDMDSSVGVDGGGQSSVPPPWGEPAWGSTANVEVGDGDVDMAMD